MRYEKLILIVLITAIYIFIGAGSVSITMAASPGACDKYAKTAQEQLKTGKSKGCKNLNYPVWSDDYNHHYNWCLNQPQSELDKGTKLRQDVLNKCAPVIKYERVRSPLKRAPGSAIRKKGDDLSGPGDIGKARGAETKETMCKKYAQDAFDLNQEAERLESKGLGCSVLKGGNWHSQYQVHFDKCMMDRIPNPGKTIKQMQAELKKCNTCNSYAKTAVDLNKKREKQKCARGSEWEYKYPRWSSDEDHHNRWCLQGENYKTADSHNRRRESEIKRCTDCEQFEKQIADFDKQYENLLCRAPNSLKFNVVDACLYPETKDYASYIRDTIKAKKTELARCNMNKPLNGDFKITKITPHYGASRQVDSIDISVSANSKNDWVIGNYGNEKYGSLWVKLKLRSFVLNGGKEQDKTHNSFFAIGGTSNVPAMIAPYVGKKIPAGSQNFVIKVKPFTILSGVLTIWNNGKACTYNYPWVEAEVFISTPPNVNQDFKKRVYSTSFFDKKLISGTYYTKKDLNPGGMGYTACKEGEL